MERLRLDRQWPRSKPHRAETRKPGAPPPRRDPRNIKKKSARGHRHRCMHARASRAFPTAFRTPSNIHHFSAYGCTRRRDELSPCSSRGWSSRKWAHSGTNSAGDPVSHTRRIHHTIKRAFATLRRAGHGKCVGSSSARMCIRGGGHHEGLPLRAQTRATGYRSRARRSRKIK